MIGDEIDVWDSPGESPKFMSQGWNGHIGINVNTPPDETLDRRNCIEPDFGTAKEGY